MAPRARPDSPEYIRLGDQLLIVLGMPKGRTHLGKWLSQRRKRTRRYGSDLQVRAVETAIGCAVQDLFESPSSELERELERILIEFNESPALATRSILDRLASHPLKSRRGDRAVDDAQVIELFRAFVESLCRGLIAHTRSSPRRRNSFDMETDCQEAEFLRKDLEGRGTIPSRNASQFAAFFTKAIGDPSRWIGPLQAYPAAAARLLRRYSHELFELDYGSLARSAAEIVLRSAHPSDEQDFDPIALAHAFEMYVMAPMNDSEDALVVGEAGLQRVDELMSSVPLAQRVVKDNPAVASIVDIINITAKSLTTPLARRLNEDAAEASTKTRNPGYRLAASEFILDRRLNQHPDAPPEGTRLAIQRLIAIHDESTEPCRRIRLARKAADASVLAVRHGRDPSTFFGALGASVTAGLSTLRVAGGFGERWMARERVLLERSIEAVSAIVMEYGTKRV